MSVYQIEIKDEALEEAVSYKVERLVQAIVEDELTKSHFKFVKNTQQMIKDIVYSHKDEIIEKVVKRATAEIVRKGLPKLIERMDNDESQD